MTFDLREFRIVTIGPSEPALLVSLLLSSVVSWLLGKGLGRVTRWVADPWRRRLYMGPIWLASGLAFLVLPNVMVDVVYAALHPNERHAMVCVAIVWPTFILPVASGILAAFHALEAPGRSNAGVAPG